MFHMHTVFITHSIVPCPLHYDKYLDLSCKSHTLAQIIINVLYIYIICSTSKMPMRSTEHQHDQGEALFANMDRGVGMFFQNCHSFLPIRQIKSDGLYCRMAGTPSSTTPFFIRVEIKYIICSITCS